MARVPLLTTVQLLAAELGVSVWVLYELVRKNQIPHIRFGRAIKFSRPAIDAWLQGSAPHELVTETEAAHDSDITSLQQAPRGGAR